MYTCATVSRDSDVDSTLGCDEMMLHDAHESLKSC